MLYTVFWLQMLFDYLTLTFADLPEEERISNFSVCTHFPKVELTDKEQTIEAAVRPMW